MANRSSPTRTPKPDDPEQSKRFIEAARELGCDESGEAMECAFAKAVPPKVPEKPKTEK